MQFAVANSSKMHKDRFCEGKIITNRNQIMNKAQLVEKIATDAEISKSQRQLSQALKQVKVLKIK